MASKVFSYLSDDLITMDHPSELSKSDKMLMWGGGEGRRGGKRDRRFSGCLLGLTVIFNFTNFFFSLIHLNIKSTTHLWNDQVNDDCIVWFVFQTVRARSSPSYFRPNWKQSTTRKDFFFFETENQKLPHSLPKNHTLGEKRNVQSYSYHSVKCSPFRR